jgi:hypothetical protein
MPIENIEFHFSLELTNANGMFKKPRKTKEIIAIT